MQFRGSAGKFRGRLSTPSEASDESFIAAFNTVRAEVKFGMVADGLFIHFQGG